MKLRLEVYKDKLSFFYFTSLTNGVVYCQTGFISSFNAPQD